MKKEEGVVDGVSTVPYMKFSKRNKKDKTEKLRVTHFKTQQTLGKRKIKRDICN